LVKMYYGRERVDNFPIVPKKKSNYQRKEKMEKKLLKRECPSTRTGIGVSPMVKPSNIGNRGPRPH